MAELKSKEQINIIIKPKYLKTTSQSYISFRKELHHMKTTTDNFYFAQKYIKMNQEYFKLLQIIH